MVKNDEKWDGDVSVKNEMERVRQLSVFGWATFFSPSSVHQGFILLIKVSQGLS